MSGIGKTQDPEFWESKLPHVLFAGLFLRQIRAAIWTDFYISCSYSLELFEQIELDTKIKCSLFLDNLNYPCNSLPIALPAIRKQHKITLSSD